MSKVISERAIQMKTKKITRKTAGTCYQATGTVKSGSMNRVTTCGEPAEWDYFDGSSSWAMPLCDSCYRKRMGVNALRVLGFELDDVVDITLDK